MMILLIGAFCKVYAFCKYAGICVVASSKVYIRVHFWWRVSADTETSLLFKPAASMPLLKILDVSELPWMAVVPSYSKFFRQKNLSLNSVHGRTLFNRPAVLFCLTPCICSAYLQKVDFYRAFISSTERPVPSAILSISKPNCLKALAVSSLVW